MQLRRAHGRGSSACVFPKVGMCSTALALALALAGDANRSQALADDLGKRFPEDTIVQLQLPSNHPRSACAQPQ